MEAEAHHREHRRYETLLKTARFRYQATVAEVICLASRNLDQTLFLRLAEGGFSRRGESVFITGAQNYADALPSRLEPTDPVPVVKGGTPTINLILGRNNN